MPYMPPTLDELAGDGTDPLVRQYLQSLTVKYSPSQPRVPAGNGRESGEFASSDTNGDGISDHHHEEIDPGVKSYNDLPPKVQDKIDAKAEKVGLSKETIKANMEKVYDSMTPEERASLTNWYTDAHDFSDQLAQKYGVAPEQAAGVVAALAPLRAWNGPSGNKDAADRVLQILADNKPLVVTQEAADNFNTWAAGKTGDVKALAGTLEPGTYLPQEMNPIILASQHPDSPVNAAGVVNVGKAFAIAQGTESVSDALGGPKIRSFYDNIADPSDPAATTIDTWMYRIGAGDTPIRLGTGNDDRSMPLDQWEHLDSGARGAGTLQSGVSLTQNKVKVYDAGLYGLYAQAVDENAAAHGLIPNQYQAIVWGKWVNDHTGKGKGEA